MAARDRGPDRVGAGVDESGGSRKGCLRRSGQRCRSHRPLPARPGLCLRSLTEGYGLPPLEAMRAGTPSVIANEVPSVVDLDEPGPPPALIVDPVDVEAIAEGLIVWQPMSRPGRLVARGEAHARSRTWRTAAISTSGSGGRWHDSRESLRCRSTSRPSRCARGVRATTPWRWREGCRARQDIALTMVSRRGDEERWQDVGGGAGSVVGAVPVSRPGRLALRTGPLSPASSAFARCPGAPRAALHHARTGARALRRDHSRLHVLRPPRVARAIEGAAVSPGDPPASCHAAALVCVSEVTATRLRACCEVRAPIVVAPHGVDHERFTPTSRRPGRSRHPRGERGAPRPPARRLRGHAGAPQGRGASRRRLRPCGRCAPRCRAGPVRADRLGPGGDRSGPGRARHGDRIRRTGYLPDAAVPALLRQATVVAYPALEEGFGLPALEALACGAPLITTEGTAMAEMAQGRPNWSGPGMSMPHWPMPSGLALDTGEGGARGQATAGLGLTVAAGFTWAASVAARRGL
jgi:glycosyltransferase involved in cell wall biosynthesis